MADIAELRNPFAELIEPDSGILVTAAEAGGKGNYYCPHPNCLDPERRLFRKPSKRGRYFFCHYGDFEHVGNPETLLHKLAIRHFKELTEFKFPELNGNFEMVSINPDKTVLEYNGLKDLKPDVRIVSTSGVEYFIEIFVTHETKGKKIALIGQYQKPTIEIDLKPFYKLNMELCKNDLSFVKSKIPELLSDEGLKKWIYHPGIIAKEEETKPILIDLPPNKPTQTIGSLSTGEKLALGAVISALVVAIIPPFRRAAIGILKSFFGGRR